MNFSAAALLLMAEKGLTILDLAEIVAANDVRADPTANERQRRCRANKKANGHAVTVTRDKGSDDRDILTSRRDQKPKPNGLVKKADKGFRLPLDWQPQTLTGKAAQMVACWQAGELERELAKFKNYWLAKGANAARTDWQRTWVNWLISADERKPRGTYERSDRDPTTVAVERFLSGDVGTHAGAG